MGILSWLVLGLVVGVLAKFIMPGKDGGGIFVTMGLGIAGAFVGGFLGSALGLGDVSGFNLGSIGLATGGALILLERSQLAPWSSEYQVQQPPPWAGTMMRLPPSTQSGVRRMPLRRTGLPRASSMRCQSPSSPPSEMWMPSSCAPR